MAWLWSFCVVWIFSFSAFAQTTEAKEMTFKKGTILLGSKKIQVELAQSPSEQEHGLMFRKSLGIDDGMLFVFQKEEVLRFWMKNTLIDLSIGYFDKNKTLIDIQEMTSPSVMETNLQTYPSKSPAQYALEMNKNWFAKNKIKLGAKLKILSDRQ